jgi:hypothetical protein
MPDLTFDDLKLGQCYTIHCEKGSHCIGVTLFDYTQPQEAYPSDIIKHKESILVLEKTEDPHKLLVLGPRKKGLIEKGQALSVTAKYCYRLVKVK